MMLASNPGYQYTIAMKNTDSDAALNSTVSALSDRRLLERLKELSAVEHQLEVVVIDHLRELQRRRLYLTLGFSSLFDYAVRELGYSDAAAWRRIKAMRLCAEIEGARERLRDGSLTMNAAAQLQNAFDRQDRKQAGGARGAQAGTRAAALSNGSPPPAAARPKEPHAAPVLDDSARQTLVEQAAGKSTRQVKELLAEVDPELAAPADRTRPLGAGRWELKAVIDDDCRHGLDRLKGLLSHVDPHMTLGQLVGRLVREGLDRHDPGRPPRGRRSGSRTARAAQTPTSAPKEEAVPSVAPASAPMAAAVADATAGTAAQRTALPARGATSPPKVHADSEYGGASAAKRPAPDARTGTSAPKTERRLPAKPRVIGRAIPAAVKRQVWERDRGCCSYVDRGSGRRCGSRHLLQVDHIFPYALGGGAELDNLRLLCAAHHHHRHAGRAAARRNE